MDYYVHTSYPLKRVVNINMDRFPIQNMDIISFNMTEKIRIYYNFRSHTYAIHIFAYMNK